MKLNFKKLAVAAALALAHFQAQAINFDFGNIGTGVLRFFAANDTFQFINSTQAGSLGYSFTIAASDGVGDAIGDLGKIDGVFTIGAISTPSPGYQSANVTGSGTMTIKDHAGSLLTGVLVWNSIFTFGTSGGMNSGSSFNMTSISYGGSEQDLLDLSTSLGQQASVTLSFGFAPARSLTSLTTGTRARSSSFSGDIQAQAQVPDGGTTVGLLGFGLLALGAFRRRIA